MPMENRADKTLRGRRISGIADYGTRERGNEIM